MSIAILIALVISAALIIWAIPRRKAKKIAAERDAHLLARQAAIQSAIDRAGAVLKDPNTLLDSGEDAAATVLAELRSLNQDGSLDDLISDTQQFIAEWRTSRSPA